MKRILCLLLTALFLCGCSSSPEPSEKAEEPQVVLKYYTIGREDPDLELVSQQLSDLLFKRYGFGIDYQRIDFNTYKETINAVINTDQKFDVLFTWDNHYYRNASQGIFLDLTPYLSHQGFSLQNAVDERFWKGVQVKGRVYGVPTNKELAPVAQFLFSRDLVEKYRMHPEKCHTIEDLEPLLALIQRNEPKVAPMVFTSERVNLAELIGYEYAAGENLPFVIKRGDPACHVVNLYETEEMENLQATLRRYYEKGYINKDATIRTAISRFSEEQVFCRIGSGGPDSAESFSVDFGYPIVSVPVSTPWVTNTSARGGVMAVNAKTAHPEEALTFLTAVNLDPEVRNLLNFGVEGVHYELTDQNQVRVLSEGYRGVPYTQGNWFILKTMEGENPQKWQRYQQYNEQAKSSYLLGFEPDLSGFQQEKNQVSQAYLRYDNALLTGSVDPEIYRERALRQMHLAGAETIQNELQRQINFWLADHPAA